MKWITLIPVRRNDGTPVTKAEQRQIIWDLFQSFGGATVDGPVSGHWIDDKDGRHYQDDCVRVTIVCDNDRIRDAEDAVLAIGRQLGQEAMYFEVQYFDGVRFLRP